MPTPEVDRPPKVAGRPPALVRAHVGGWPTASAHSHRDGMDVGASYATLRAPGLCTTSHPGSAPLAMGSVPPANETGREGEKMEQEDIRTNGR